MHVCCDVCVCACTAIVGRIEPIVCVCVFVEEQERVYPISKTLTIFHDTVPKFETVQN